MRHHLVRAARERRERRQFNRALNSASPAMQQELIAAWQRQISIR
jgi:hypothetical protein